jgi:signal transduction histidine kinase/CheY-like chemotaxis protein
VNERSLSEQTSESVVADLAASDFQVAPQTLCNRVASHLQQHPEIPGVLICEDVKLLGVISREKFLDLLSRPFGLELFMKRPIEAMLEAVLIEPLILHCSTRIDEASRLALTRPRDLVYEPVVVADPDGRVRLLSVYTLLLAQSRLLAAANETIQRQKNAADAANQAKSTFLANMSHEIRTPMNGVLGITEILLDTPISAAQRKYLQMIRESADSLLSVINEILDFSKIEASRLELETVDFSLRDCLGDALAAMALCAQSKGIELINRIHLDVPDRLCGDPLRLRQIVTNLVSNAVKFTHVGEIILEVAVQSRSAQAIEVYVQVRDTGIGIPPHKRAEIFDSFAQVEASTARTFGGTGLGLAISRKLIELMKGRIWVDSEVDRGSNFQFTAQFQLPALQVPPTKLLFPEGLLVLLVDDNHSSRTAIQEMLQSWRIRPLAVATISAAREVLANIREPVPFVLIDNALVGSDGFSFASELLEANPEVRVIMLLTADEHGFDVARCQQLGVSGYVTKPIKQSELFTAIAESLGIVHEEAAAVPLEAPLKRRRILLVEDGMVNQAVARGLLEPRGHTVVVANDGHEALAGFLRQPFDLILMDVQMPGMDGFEATARIRVRESITEAHTPIVAMTANAMTGDRERCLSAGMDGYLAKPIRKCELLALVETEWIESLTSRGSGHLVTQVSSIRSPATHGNDEFEAANTRSLGESRCVPDSIDIDWNRALEELSGDAALLTLVVNTLLEEAPNLWSMLRQALVGRNAGQLRLAAHTLKGSVSHLGVERLTSVLQLLEAAANAGEIDDAQRLLLQAEEDFSRLVPALNDFARSRRGCGCHSEVQCHSAVDGRDSGSLGTRHRD